MHVLFVHRAFPAQFGQLALELTQRYGWRCSFIVGRLTQCPPPSPEMLANLRIYQLPAQLAARNDEAIPWPQVHGHALELGQAVFETVRQHPELRPDLVVGHGGLLPTLFLRELLRCPLIDYCEYYFARNRRDLTYRVDLPAAEPAPFYPRCINAATLLNLVACDAAYTPTPWQRHCFPQRFWPKIEVHFDGIDTRVYRPQTVPRVVAGSVIPPETRVVTFAARGLEAMRGFDLFVQLAQRIAERRPDVLFLVAGNEQTYYGWDSLWTGGCTFKQWVLQKCTGDTSRFVFLGALPPEQLAALLCLSDLHVYLTVPFVVSWSLLNALACGCVVLAGDVPPVRDILVPQRNGLLEPLHDLERLTQTALDVLDNPDKYRPLRQAAQAEIAAGYGLERCVPELKAFFERTAALG